MISNDDTVRCYIATEQGVRAARELEQRLDPGVREYVNDLLSWLTSLSFNALVREVYRQYPEMKVNSVFSS